MGIAVEMTAVVGSLSSGLSTRLIGDGYNDLWPIASGISVS
jgi:hypothetical protein